MDGAKLAQKPEPPLVDPSKWMWAGHARKQLERARWPQIGDPDLKVSLKAPDRDFRELYILDWLLKRLNNLTMRAVFHDPSMPAGHDVELKERNHWLRKEGAIELYEGGDWPMGRRGILARFRHLLLLERHVEAAETELALEAANEEAARIEAQSPFLPPDQSVEVKGRGTAPAGQTKPKIEEPAARTLVSTTSEIELKVRTWLREMKPKWGDEPPTPDGVWGKSWRGRIKRQAFRDLFEHEIGSRNPGEKKLKGNF